MLTNGEGAGIVKADDIPQGFNISRVNNIVAVPKVPTYPDI